jgi:hypothetical protein
MSSEIDGVPASKITPVNEYMIRMEIFEKDKKKTSPTSEVVTFQENQNNKRLRCT